MGLAIALGVLSVTFVSASLLAFRFSNPLVRMYYIASAIWFGFVIYLVPAGMRVAAQSQFDSFGFGDFQVIGCVGEQQAGFGGVQTGAAQNRLETKGIGGIAVSNANDLQTFEHDLFAVEHANTCTRHGFLISCVTSIFLVITGHEVNALGSVQLAQGLGQAVDIGRRAVVEVAGDEKDIRPQPVDQSRDAPGECHILDVAQMQVA